MDMIILGLLLFRGRTIYELRARFAEGLYMMYSSSMGSIQVAVKKLLAGGYIECVERVENGKFKKVYEITQSGREAFSVWVNSPFEAAQNKSPELAKLYFMGLSEGKERAARVREHIEKLRESHAALELVCRQGEEAEAPPELAELLEYQLKTAQFGRDMVAFQIEWFTKLAAELEG